MRALLVFSVLLSGCGWMNDGEGLFVNPKDDYLDAQQHQDLVIPQDLRTLEDTDPFPIPPTPESQNPSFYPNRPPLPDAIYANDTRDEVRIQRLDDRRWLVIPEPPTTAWPKIKQFLAENGVRLDLDAPEVGRLNTQWLAIEDTAYRDIVRSLLKEAKQAAELDVGRDRFVIKVEQGLRPLTTEIHVRHENDSTMLPMADDVIALDTFVSQIEVAESNFLNEIGAYIAAKVAEQTVSKVALQIGSARKAELARDGQGLPVLLLYLDYERAWATLGQALANANVDVNDLSRQTGTFDVTLTDAVFSGEEDEGPGFFCRLTFSCDRDEVYDLRIQVRDIEQQHFEVSVLEADGSRRADPELAQQVLVLIREYSA